MSVITPSQSTMHGMDRTLERLNDLHKEIGEELNALRAATMATAVATSDIAVQTNEEPTEADERLIDVNEETVSGWQSAFGFLRTTHLHIVCLTEEGAVRWMLLYMNMKMGEQMQGKNKPTVRSTLQNVFPDAITVCEDIVSAVPLRRGGETASLTHLDALGLFLALRQGTRESCSKEMTELLQSSFNAANVQRGAKWSGAHDLGKTGIPRIAWLSYLLAPDSVVGPFLLLLMGWYDTDSSHKAHYTIINNLIDILTNVGQWHELGAVRAFPQILQGYSQDELTMLTGMLTRTLPQMALLIDLVLRHHVIKKRTWLPNLVRRFEVRGVGLCLRYGPDNNSVDFQGITADIVDKRHWRIRNNGQESLGDAGKMINIGPAAHLRHIPLDWHERPDALTGRENSLAGMAMVYANFLAHQYATYPALTLRYEEQRNRPLFHEPIDVLQLDPRVQLARECMAAMIPRFGDETYLYFSVYIVMGLTDSAMFKRWEEQLLLRLNDDSGAWKITEESTGLLLRMVKNRFMSKENARRDSQEPYGLARSRMCEVIPDFRQEMDRRSQLADRTIAPLPRRAAMSSPSRSAAGQQL